MTVCRPDSPIVEQGILLRELNHRINSGLASAINLVSAAAVRAEGSEAKRALSDMVELLQRTARIGPVATRPDPNPARGAQPVSARPAADALGELLSPR